MPDIFDRDSFKKWLYNQPRSVAVALSTRAVLRVFPLIAADGYPAKKEVVIELAFHIFRACFMSLTTVSAPRVSANPASLQTTQTDISFATGFSAEIAQAAITTMNATHTATYAAYAALAAHSSAQAAESIDVLKVFWQEIAADAELIERGSYPLKIADLPLWSTGIPVVLQDHYASLKQYLSEDAHDWGFWQKWIEDCLSGNSKNWAQMEEISDISAEDWAKGAAFVNPILSGLVSPTEAYATIEKPTDPDALQLALARVDDALDDALTANGGIEERSLECVILRRLQVKYAGDMQRVEMDLTLVQRGLTRQIENGELPDQPEIQALVDICGTGAIDLRAANPELAKTQKARKTQVAKERPALKLIKGKVADNVVPHKPASVRQKIVATRSSANVPLPKGAVPLPSVTVDGVIRNAEAETPQKTAGLLGRLGIGPFSRRQDAVGE